MKNAKHLQTPKPPKPQKNLWVVVFKNGTVAIWSLGFSKKQAISNFFEGAYWIKNKGEYWKEIERKGIRCTQVKVSFEPVVK